jgi:hypothetical protein
MSVVKLRPGYLVSLKTRIYGGPKYTHAPIDTDAAPTEGATVEKFLTTKITEDPEEYARAVKVRGKAGSLVRSECIPSDFGLLCPTAKKSVLDDAIKEAKATAAYFNDTSKTCHVSVFVITGEVAESDTEAAAAISSELRDLMETMQVGIGEANVQKIRDAADKAKKLGAMLDADTGKKVAAAIAEARDVAKQIVKKLTTNGEDAAEFVQSVKLKALEEARFAFLDLDGEAEAGEKLSPVEARGLDLDAEPVAEHASSDDAQADDPSNDLKMVAAGAGTGKYDL